MIGRRRPARACRACVQASSGWPAKEPHATMIDQQYTTVRSTIVEMPRSGIREIMDVDTIAVDGDRMTVEIRSHEIGELGAIGG
jgi:hypothetical protein